MRIIDQYGQPFDSGVLKEPQTSRVTALQNQFLTPMLAGLTPAKLSTILKQADDGDLLAQHRLFADMEERDAHLLCEIGKRKLAVMDLDWDIVPPRNATAAEKGNAEWVKEVLTDAVDPLEDLLLALMEGVGHGFAAVELEWRQEGREWLPAFQPQPQEWFCLDRFRKELRLADASAEGAPLQPFGWVLHTHGKAKTGYLGRMGLHRALVWPFLYKAYSLGDFAEFLETYGLPIVLGKYYNGASADEKASLMRAVTALGHDARAIMPADMQLEINKVSADGSGTPHLAMIDWADRAQSKAILGQTTSSEARATGLGSGVASVHNEVRHDIRNADARQIAGTLTRDLIFPLLALNKGGIDSLKRCPRLVFDTGEPEDLALLADGVDKLVKAGMRTIPVKWVHEKARIPEPADGEETLGAPANGEPPANPLANPGKTPGSPPQKAALAALLATPPAPTSAADPVDLMTERLAQAADPRVRDWLDTIKAMLDSAESLEEFRERLLAAYPDLDSGGMVAAMQAAFAAAELAGRYEVSRENPEPPTINVHNTFVMPEPAALAAQPPAEPPAPPIVNVTVQPAQVQVINEVQPTPVNVAAPNVSVTNEVQPAPVNNVVTPTHPARAVQTVERDPQTSEVVRTVTEYEQE